LSEPLFFSGMILKEITKQSGYFNSKAIFSFDDGTAIIGLNSGKIISRTILFLDYRKVMGKLSSGKLMELLQYVDEKCKDDVYIEIRNLNDGKNYDQAFIMYGFQWLDWFNYKIELSAVNHQFEKIHATKRRQIKRSRERGVIVEEAQSAEEVTAFYNILHKVYVHRVRKPLPDKNFFLSFYEKTKGTEYGTILLAKRDGKVIAGMLCPIDPYQEMYEWYVAGLDKEYKGKGIYPSVMITWGAIEYAINHQIPVFNFMGAGEPGKPYGVRNFKMQFGGELINSGRYLKINKPFLYHLGKTYFRLREIF